MSTYFGDIRDRFDELYATAASFVHIGAVTLFKGSHVRFHVDLYSAEGIRHFRALCYSYEDSFDWKMLPLVYDPELPAGLFRWQRGVEIASELPVERALATFDTQCHQLLEPR